MKLKLIRLTGLILPLIYGVFSNVQSDIPHVKRKLGDSFIFPEKTPQNGFLRYGHSVSLSTVALISNWNISQMYTDEFSGRLQVDIDDRTLAITDLRLEDSGIYQLEALTGVKFTKSYNLTVYVPVSPPKVSSVPSENGSCSLFCSVENDTQVTVFWQKGGNSRILLLEKQEADKQYTCVAENSFSQENITVTTEEMCGWKDEDGENVQPRSHYIISTVIAAACILIAIVLIVCLRRKLLQKEGSTRSRNGDDLQYAEVILHERGSKQNLRELGASQETKSKLTTVYGKISYAPPLTE
ncbi:SLAM family member 5-like isoform X2 [Erpetoichthys calabaricus]|uniref:SLAM family member 5-like isoform X2 n=1 Tax=Erpetoichthys calabaricus TaxID=27687 RepID=UPI002234CC98|nr:SLAM family member 5-like isoform X2 [Erpetoichthys calabaricus]